MDLEALAPMPTIHCFYISQMNNPPQPQRGDIPQAGV